MQNTTLTNELIFNKLNRKHAQEVTARREQDSIEQNECLFRMADQSMGLKEQIDRLSNKLEEIDQKGEFRHLFQALSKIVPLVPRAKQLVWLWVLQYSAGQASLRKTVLGRLLWLAVLLYRTFLQT